MRGITREEIREEFLFYCKLCSKNSIFSHLTPASGYPRSADFPDRGDRLRAGRKTGQRYVNFDITYYYHYDNSNLDDTVRIVKGFFDNVPYRTILLRPTDKLTCSGRRMPAIPRSSAF